MEAPEEVNTHAVKGKRTKRKRVPSPSPLCVTANSLSEDGCGDDYGNEKNCIKWSPSTSHDEFQDSTEEEEDMANCLILLAKGHSKETTKQDKYYVPAEGLYNTKFNSRRFLETASTGSGKVGYYVYACKTCSRTFPSFQALGGHRASHKKPKAIQNDEKRHAALSSDEEDGHYKNVSSLSLHLIDNSHNNNNRGMCGAQNNKAKIHECSICGAEFTSGQALGGHMRRHRGPVVASSTTLSLAPIAVESEEPKKARNLLSLDLDLNLPAPEDDKFPFASKQQQQKQQQQQRHHQEQQQKKSPIVFTSPALVDCHY